MREISEHSKTCGVSDCNMPTVVNINSRNVTRCARHFCQDLDDYKQGHRTPRIAGRFHAEKAVMDSLENVGLIQGDNESLRDYSQRCKTYSLKTMGGLLPASLKR
jgi:hypothetical protein